MKRIIGALIVTMAIGVPSIGVSAPAHADDREQECERGYCGNEREEDYRGAECKYFCPSFKDSPVDRSFNPVICVLPDSCRFEGGGPSGSGSQDGGEGDSGGRVQGGGSESPRATA